jgi:hypothetical protein
MSNDDRAYLVHPAPTAEEIGTALNILGRFYDYAPFGHREIKHTNNALDVYRDRIPGSAEPRREC